MAYSEKRGGAVAIVCRPEVHFFIYIATPQASDSPCKIGFSGNPDRRMQALNCGRAEELHLRSVIACPPGIPEWGSSSPYRELRYKAKRIESKIHAELRLFKLRGEWFDIEWGAAAALAMREATTV